jgi:5'(3')-deoxyribonucleotidase
MVILVDMDDTIEHLLETWVNVLNKRYNRNVDWKEIKRWDTLAVFPGLTHEQVHGVLEEDDFWKQVEPIAGARETLEYFISCGIFHFKCSPESPSPSQSHQSLLRQRSGPLFIHALRLDLRK